MIPSSTYYDKEAVKPLHVKQQSIQHSYVVYVPKIVTFRYEQSPPKKKQTVCLSYREQNKNPMAVNKITDSGRKVVYLNKKKKSMVNSVKKKERNGRITLTSSKQLSKNTVEQKHHPNVSSFTRCSDPLAQPCHISSQRVHTNFSCDLFECNGMEGVDQYERQPFDHLKLSQSFSSLDQNDEKSSPQHGETNHSQNDTLSQRRSNSFFLNQSFGYFHKRKSIFEGEVSRDLNTTIGVCNTEKERSQSKRRSIFKKKQRKDASVDMERSLSKRKRIFTSPKQQISPKFGVSSQQQQLQDTEIPHCIRQNWEHFSQSRVYETARKQNKLDTVRQLNIQESGIFD